MKTSIGSWRPCGTCSLGGATGATIGGRVCDQRVIILFLAQTAWSEYRQGRHEGRIMSRRQVLLPIAIAAIVGGAFGLWFATRA
jgi:hypothetical protein